MIICSKDTDIIVVLCTYSSTKKTLRALVVLDGCDSLTSYLGMHPMCIFVMKDNYLVGENKHLRHGWACTREHDSMSSPAEECRGMQKCTWTKLCSPHQDMKNGLILEACLQRKRLQRDQSYSACYMTDFKGQRTAGWGLWMQ